MTLLSPRLPSAAQVLKQPAFDGQQLVLLLMVLRAEVNVGYEESVGLVASLNGEPVQSLAQLKQQIEGQADGHFTFKLESGDVIVLSAAKCWQSEEAIFRTHCIPHRASQDLRSS